MADVVPIPVQQLAAAPVVANNEPLIVLDPPMTVAEKKTALILHRAFDEIFKVFSKWTEDHWKDRSGNEIVDVSKNLWDIWNSPDFYYKKHPGHYYGIQAIQAKRIIAFFFPTLFHTVESASPPRDAFRSFISVAACYSPQLKTNPERLVEQWRNEPHGVLWRQAVKDMENGIGEKYGFLRWNYSDVIAYKLASILEAFKKGCLHVKVKWQDEEERKYEEEHQVLSLGFLDHPTCCVLQARFAWPLPTLELKQNENGSDKDPVAFKMITELATAVLSPANSRWPHTCSRRFHIQENHRSERLRIVFKEESGPHYDEDWDIAFPDWYLKFKKKEHLGSMPTPEVQMSPPPILYNPVEMNAIVFEPVHSLNHVILRRVFGSSGEWFQMTRFAQRRVCIELGMTLFDSLSLKRPRDETEVTLDHDPDLMNLAKAEDDREQREVPELAAMPNCERWSFKKTKRPKLTLFGQ